MSQPPFPMLGEIFALSCAVLWAYAMIQFRLSARTLNPLAMNFFKSVFILPLMLVTTLLWGDIGALRNACGADLLLMSASAVCGLYVADTLLFAGLKMVGASIPFITSCLYAPAVIVGAYFFLGEDISLLTMLGAAVVVLGIVLVSTDKFGIPKDIPRSRILTGIIVSSLSALLAAAGVIMLKAPLGRLGVFEVTLFRMIVGVVPLTIHILLAGHAAEAKAALRPSPSWRNMVPATLIGTYIAMLLWVGGLKYTTAHTASILNQTSPLFGIVLAAYFLDEKLTPRKLAGALAAFAGILLIFSG